MYDPEIRKMLYQTELKQENGLIIEEMGLLQGEGRIDIAVINGQLHGYEIKSEHDSTRRLPSQMAIYNRVFDRMTIVTEENHLRKINKMVPEWWGIIKDSARIRESKTNGNGNVDPHALSQLLWKSEALSILTDKKAAKGLKSKPRSIVWATLVEVAGNEIKSIVRETLKNRKKWR